jgi:hypothetical protein
MKNNHRKPTTPSISFLTRRVIPQGMEQVAYVYNPQECENFDWIKGKTVELNGRRFRVRKVERTTQIPVCRKGETIRLIGNHS